MSLMNWNEKLDVGVHEMNDEHKGLLDLMNKLYDISKQKAPFSSQLQVLNDLKNATVQHFEHEEAYMEKIGWESASSHKYIHKGLLESFSKHYDEAQKNSKIPEEFFDFLKFWLAAHIQGIDKKYGDFANKKIA